MYISLTPDRMEASKPLISWFFSVPSYHYMSLINLHSLSQIHSVCLLCENGSGPFKYSSFASWHGVKLYQ